MIIQWKPENPKMLIFLLICTFNLYQTYINSHGLCGVCWLLLSTSHLLSATGDSQGSFLRLANKDSFIKAGTVPTLNKAGTPPLFLPDGERGWMTCAAWGCRKRAQVSNCVPASLSDFLSCHLFSRKVIYVGLCSHLEDIFLWITSGWLCKNKSLERMQAEFGLGWSCMADGSHGR